MHIFMYVYIYIYIYIYIHVPSSSRTWTTGVSPNGNPHRAQISQFELFELILLLKLEKRFPVEQFEATVSQSKVPSPPLTDDVDRNHTRSP